MANDLTLTDTTDDLLPFFQTGCEMALGIFGIVAGVANSVVNSVGNYIDADLERKAVTERQFMELQYNLQLAQIRREEAEIQAQKELAIAEMENKTEQFRIAEQSKCLQKALDVALASYNRKLDFYAAQLKSCDDFFRPQIASMHEEIHHLESKIDEAFGDTKKYVLLQKRLNRLNEYCDEVNSKYMKLQSDLTTAVKLAQLEAPDPRAFYLGNTSQKVGYLE